MTISRQRVDKHIPAEDNGRNNGSIAMQLWNIQASSTIQAVFYVGSLQSGYKRVEFRPWQFKSCERTSMGTEVVQRSKTENNGVSLRKQDLMCAVVTVRLL
jgi:hypothetical protein